MHASTHSTATPAMGDGAGERQWPGELGEEPNKLKKIGILDYVRVETSSPSKARGPLMWLGSERSAQLPRTLVKVR